MTLHYHPEAATELLKSIEYYESKAEGLGAEFLDEVEFTIPQIKSFPEAGTLITEKDRGVLLNRFPYGVIYVVEDPKITIYAIMHLRRKPGYWKARK